MNRGTDATAIVPAGHSRPVGRYSPGLAVPLDEGRDLVMVSGQVASDDAGRLVGADSPAAQAEAVFDRLEAVLQAAGGGLADLVSVVIYLVDRDHFGPVSAVRNRRLGDPPPASTLVVVARLAEEGRLVEISGVAVVARRRP
jgi:enamine deaminase RidA (YjgF/YER057c/UK114 family)